ncbi:MAG TPA: F0F1 ATP synthase subunit A [Thermoanaerobaculia bacterium]|nr:F0F1 ATP synthase subunit A [Thermoanaerobaculia bacterium]
MAFFLMFATDPMDHVVQHPIIQRPADLGLLTPEGQISVLTNQTAMMIVAGLLLILFVPAMVRRRRGSDEVGRLVPTGSANAIEAICEYLRKEVAQPNLLGYTDRFIKYIWSVFFFILVCNLLGLLPVSAITPLFGSHIGGTATGNIWVTATLALMTFGLMVFNGIRLGGAHYFAHFCPGPLWLSPILVPVEIAGLIAKIFALTVRLFANMLAGHILLAVLLGFILSAGASSAALGFGIAIPAVAGSVAITMLEIFVAFLQAFIFTFLTCLFIGQSIVFHHGDEHEHGHGEAAAH